MKSKILFFILAFSTLSNAQNKQLIQMDNSAQKTETVRTTDPAHVQLNKKNLSSQKLSLSENTNALSGIEKMKADGKQEDLSKRDAFSKHFTNKDGSYTAVVSSGPIHFQKNGQWQDINTKINKSSKNGFAYENTDNLLQSYFGATAKIGVESSTEQGVVKEFLNTKMYWETKGKSTQSFESENTIAITKDNQLTYENIYPFVDAEFTIETGKRKLNYILKDKNFLQNTPKDADYLVFSEDLLLPSGWTYEVNTKQDIELKDHFGKTAFIYPHPEIFENYNNNKEAFIINDEKNANFEILKDGNTLTILLKVKASWLLSPDRVFPIAIDPTVYPNNAIYWTGWSTYTGGNNNGIYSGYWSDGYGMAGYSKFNLSSIPISSIISSAQSYFYYNSRTGDIRNCKIAIVDVPIDPVTTPNWYDVFDSWTQVISSDYFTWNDNPDQNTSSWKTNNFAPSGIAFIQDGITQGFATIATYPTYTGLFNNWSTGLYAGFTGYSNANRPQLIINYTTTCTTPSSNSTTYYINNVQFVGTLIQDTTNPNTGYTSGGYGNYTALSDQAKQIPGGVVNLQVQTTGGSAFMKAWVDWNNNGLFDSTEKVYDTKSTLVPNTTFGFVVPAGTAPGFYTIRIRNHRTSPYFGPCGNLANGETEDYRFEVIADCAAKITGVNLSSSDGHRCGTGTVTLSASATSAASYRWYTTQFGGTAISGETASTYTTPSLAATTTYYVTAVSAGGCESVYRTAVIARIDPTPTISFNASRPDFCGSTGTISVSSAADKEETTIINEKFSSGLGLFQNEVAGFVNTNANWQNRTSPYQPAKPPYYVVSPAISSGFNNGNYATAITDVAQTNNITNRLALTSMVDASLLTNLKLDFDLYYFPTIPGDSTYNYLLVEATANNGGTWNTLATYNTTQGNPGVWSKKSLTLPASYQTTQLKIRFVIFSYGAVIAGSTNWTGDIAALDNIRLYGDKALSTNFSWTGSPVVYAADCVSAVPAGGTSSVCIKPDPTQIENDASWTINANAILSNGCTASAALTIPNNTKTWNPASGTIWGNTSDWKPAPTLPTASSCVIVKKPVTLETGTNGLARNLVVENTGTLTIKDGASLSVTDFIKNNATSDDFVLENGGNLVQTTDLLTAPNDNTGSIRAENLFTLSNDRLQYNFVISPVVGQNVKTIYPGNPTAIYHSENANWFYASDGAYVEGRSLAIKEPSSAAVGSTTVTGQYRGAPFNGILNYPLAWTNNNPKSGSEHGWNLVGNPYPSTLDVKDLYDDNASKINPTFHFWDNRGNTQYAQQGSNYNGQNYVYYNASTGATGVGAAPGPIGPARIPTRFVKPGTGFMLQALSTANGATLNFKNAYRKTSAAPDYHGKSEIEDDAYWLIIKTPTQVQPMIAVVYFENGDDAFGIEDTETGGASDDLYSLVDSHQLVIQGRKPFTNTDIVPLGVNAFKDGNYTISLYDKKGIFNVGQQIFLKDKLLNIITDLSAGDYTFTTSAGIYTGRFEIIYTAGSVLGTTDTAKDAVVVYRDGEDFVVKASTKAITDLKVYDGSGKLVKHLQPRNLRATIAAATLPNGLYVLKIEQDETTVTKKIRK